jgi:Protein of unknown function (DUF992)
MWRTYLAAVVMTTCWSYLVIAEQADIEIGVLTCALAEPPEPAPSNAPTAGGQQREGFCTFKPKKGSEETYAAIFEGVSISTDRTRTVIWVVKTVAGAATLGPGVLEQSYATDSAKATDQMAPLIGETNSAIALHSMSDRSEGSASAPTKPGPTGFVILGVALKLKSSSA